MFLDPKYFLTKHFLSQHLLGRKKIWIPEFNPKWFPMTLVLAQLVQSKIKTSCISMGTVLRIIVQMSF